MIALWTLLSNLLLMLVRTVDPFLANSIPQKALRYNFDNMKIFFSILCALYPVTGLPQDSPANFLFRATFDKQINADTPKNLILERHGGTITDAGISGGALRLNDGEYLTIDVRDIVNPSGGTMMFWIKPHWGYYDQSKGEMRSHTFISFLWEDNGYFAISDGWWEPLGQYFTYFIQNNKNLIHVRPIIKFKKNQWVHIAVTWSTGPLGTIKMYVDGELVAVNKGNIVTQSAMGKMYIGSDAASPLANNKRWADSDIDNLFVLDRPLTASELQQELSAQYVRWKQHKYEWQKKLLQANNQLPETPRTEMFETRAILDEGPGEWANERKSRALIARIKRAGFNVFMPCVWHGDGTRYPSDIAPQALYAASGDALATLIRVAHENGIEVHPWFTISYRSRAFLREYYDNDTIENAFEIFRPEFRNFIVDLIIDVVRRYDIDGVNLDYIRTMGVPHSQFAINQYHKKYGRNLLSDERIFSERGDIEPHLQEFSDEAVLDVVRSVSLAAKAIKPRLIVSIDGHPSPHFFPSSEQGRQEIKWANLGLIDVIYAMDYDRDPDLARIKTVASELNEPAKIMMLTSNFDQVATVPVSRNPQDVVILTSLAQNTSPSGMGLYLYSMLTESQIDALARGPFRAAAKPFWRR